MTDTGIHNYVTRIYRPSGPSMAFILTYISIFLGLDENHSTRLSSNDKKEEMTIQTDWRTS